MGFERIKRVNVVVIKARIEVEPVAMLKVNVLSIQ
jgi:hypothetical protein